MGLMLSILVVCVGVIEALSCFEHFQYGVIHCATNVYEKARRSSVFLQYTSRRLKLLSENSISECHIPGKNTFEPIKFDQDWGRVQTQFSEGKYDECVPVRKPTAVRVSTAPVKRLEKEDKIQIVKKLLEKPGRPKAVRSISMPELVYTEEDIELTKIINDLAIEPIEEVTIEIEDRNCEVLARKFDELFNGDENSRERDSGFKGSPLGDFEEDCKNSNDLESNEETKLDQLEAVRDADSRSVSEEKEIKDVLENLKKSDDVLVRHDESDLLKTIPKKEIPISLVIKMNISQRVSDRGAALFEETLRKRGPMPKGKSSRLDRSTSVDFSEVSSIMINKYAEVDAFSKTNKASQKLISDESISDNKLGDIILQSNTPPEDVIDKTFDEIYENICDEFVDVINSFEEIENNILKDISSLETQSSDNRSPFMPELETGPVDDIWQKLSNGRTVPNAVFLKAAEQLAELLVQDSLNLKKIKNFIYEKFNSTDVYPKVFVKLSLGYPENESECRIPKEEACSRQGIPELKNVIKSEEKGIPQKISKGKYLKEEERPSVSMESDATQLVEEEFERIISGVLSNSSDTDLDMAFEFLDNLEKGTPTVASFPVERADIKAAVENDTERKGYFLDSGGTGISKESSYKKILNRLTHENSERDDPKNRVTNSVEILSDKEEAVDSVKDLEGQKPHPIKDYGDVLDQLENAPTRSLLELPVESDGANIEIRKEVREEIFSGFSEPEGIKTAVENKIELLRESKNVGEQERIKIDDGTNKTVNLDNIERGIVKIPTEIIKNGFLPTKEEKSIPVGLGKPKEDEKSKIITQLDTPSNDLTKIQIESKALLSLDYKKEINSEDSKKQGGKKMEEMPPREAVEPQKAVLESSGDIGDAERNTIILSKLIDNGKLQSDMRNKSEDRKTDVDIKTDSPRKCEGNQNGRTQEGIKVKDQSIKVDVINNTAEAVDEKNRSLPNRERDKPHALEKKKSKEDEKKEIRAPMDTSDNEKLNLVNKSSQIVESKQEPLLVLEQKKEIGFEQTELTVGEASKIVDAISNTAEVLSQNNMPISNKEGEKRHTVGYEKNTAMDTSTHGKLYVLDENVESKEEPRVHMEGVNFKSGKKSTMEQDNKSFEAVNNTLKKKNKPLPNKEEEKPHLLEQEKTKIDERMETENNCVTYGEIKTDSLRKCDGDQNGGTQLEIEVKDQSNKTGDAFNNFEILDERREIGTALNVASHENQNVMNENIATFESKPSPTVENNGKTTVEGNKKETESTQRSKNKMEKTKADEREAVEVVESVFDDKVGEQEEKVQYEQVRIMEKDDDDKSKNNWKSEVVHAEPVVMGSAEKKDEHSSESKREMNGTTSSTPEAFWLIFSGEYTKAMSKDWHSGHFSCWQCDEALTGQRYVLRDDHPYCIKCYESVFANVCEECNKIIGIDSKDLSYKDKHWHEACFLCNKCRVSLVDKQFGSKADKIYCGNCYDAQFASRCDGCGEIFRAGTKKMEYKTRQWHEKCFCCCVCKTPIGTKSFIPREQEIYCATCYEEKFATRCVKCNKIITSGGVTYKNEPWHRECFTCTNCNTSLAGQRFTSRDEKPYCADCFGELFAKRCTACSRPITGIGGTRFISFEDRHWHNDCFICASCKTSLVGRGFITDGDDIICPECAKQKLM